MGHEAVGHARVLHRLDVATPDAAYPQRHRPPHEAEVRRVPIDAFEIAGDAPTGQDRTGKQPVEIRGVDRELQLDLSHASAQPFVRRRSG
jgi:hypothetical protein